MTVSSQTNNETFTGNGVTTVWDLPFRFFDNSDIAAYLIDPVTQVATLLAQGSDYTLSGAGFPEQFGTAPGKITTATPVANLKQLFVERIMNIEQTVDIINQGRFFPEVHEDVFDRLTMFIQQANSLSADSIRLTEDRARWDFRGLRGVNAADPVNAQDVVTKNWAGNYIDSVSGLINNTAGIAYDGSNLYNYLSTGVSRVVDNIAGLRALSVSRNQRAKVLGYYQRRDGGGGDYAANPSDTTTPDNGGSVIVANDGTRWNLQNPYDIKPEQFGAIGDWNGTTGTDDSTVFSRIAAHMALYRSTLLVSKRHYVKSGWTFSASNCVVALMPGSEIHSDGASGQHTFSATNVSNVTIIGKGKFSQPRTLLRGNEFAICFTESSGINISGVKTDGATAGIWFTHCTDSRVIDCVIDTPKADGIHFAFGSSYCKAINNTVINAGDDSLAATYYDVTTGRPHDLEFRGNKTRGGVWGFGCSVYGADDVLICDNDFRECALGAVQTTIFNDSAPCTNISIKNNTIKGSNRVNVVPENYWFGTPDQPIVSPLHLSCFVLAGTNIVAIGNDIDDVSSPAVGAAGRVGCRFAGGALIKFNGNTMSRVSGSGVNGGTDGVSQGSVNDNTMDSINDVFILFNDTPLTNSLSICGNTTGIGAGAGAPNMVFLAGAGSVRVAICNNTSTAGRSVAVSTSTNVLNINNNL